MQTILAYFLVCMLVLVVLKTPSTFLLFWLSVLYSFVIPCSLCCVILSLKGLCGHMFYIIIMTLNFYTVFNNINVVLLLLGGIWTTLKLFKDRWVGWRDFERVALLFWQSITSNAFVQKRAATISWSSSWWCVSLNSVWSWTSVTSFWYALYTSFVVFPPVRKYTDRPISHCLYFVFTVSYPVEISLFKLILLMIWLICLYAIHLISMLRHYA